MTLKGDAKFKGKMTSVMENDMEFGQFSCQQSKS